LLTVSRLRIANRQHRDLARRRILNGFHGGGAGNTDDDERRIAVSTQKSSTRRKRAANRSGSGRSTSRPSASAAATTRAAAEVLRAEDRAGNSIGEQEAPFHRPRWHRAYSFGLITGALFLLSWVGQFVFQMMSVRQEAEQHGQAFQWSDFLTRFMSSTLENWQSEFLQLVWQAAGLALFYFWGSSQSKESDERLEAKIDLLLRDRGIDASKL
jgi:hypothetical protein